MSAEDSATEYGHILEQRLPAGILINDVDIARGLWRDQSSLTSHEQPVAVVAPRSSEEVSLVVREAAALDVGVTVRGLGSGLSGGANASSGAVVMSLHRMNDIVEVDPGNRLIVVQPGVVTADVRAAAREAGLYYPPDPGSVAFSSIGGNIATNAGGMCCLRYGVTGDFVQSLEVVLADGERVRLGPSTRKGVAGYDLVRLFVGSEGTLGVITEATLRLLPAPRPQRTVLTTFPSLRGAGMAAVAVATSGHSPTILEFLDRTTLRAIESVSPMGLAHSEAVLIVQIDDLGDDSAIGEISELLTRSGADDVAVSDDPAEADMLLEARRRALPALEALGDWLLDDVCVPVSRVVELVRSVQQIGEETGLTIGMFGHAGDGNLHPTVIYDAADPASCAAATTAFDRITEAALRLGGTITGEHGVGMLKRDWLEREVGPRALDLQRSIKNALDPGDLFGPQAVLNRACQGLPV